MTRKIITGDHLDYGDRRTVERRYLYGEKDRRSGKDRRQTWPGGGKKSRKVLARKAGS